MSDKNDSDIFDIEDQLKSLAGSESLTKWLSDVDVSKQIADWLVDEYDFKRWQVMAGLRIVTPIILSCGKSAGKLMADSMKQRLISRLKRIDWIKDFLEKLDDLQKKTNQQIEGENSLKERLESRIDRSAGDIEHRKALSLDLQAHLSQMDMLEEMTEQLGCIEGLLKPQPQFKRIYASADDRDRFIYRSQYIPFVGREKELNFLHDFLYVDKRVCWQAIIGPGGIGKSRLGLEFCLRNGGAYRAGILHNLNFEFEKWIPSQPTLIVIDYATQNEERLKQILDHLSNQEDSFEYNVRVLILDRDNSDSKLGDLYTDSYIRCSRYSDNPYLLNDSDADVAEAILEFFYEAEGEEVPEGWEDHIEKLKEIDPAMRPLFTAYFAEATAKGGCGRECSRESLLLDVIKREEEKFWKPNGVTEADKALLALATIVGGISTEDEFDLPTGVTSLHDLVHDKGRFKALNCEVQRKDGVIHIIPPWEPDLVGELFVLEFMKDDVDTGVNKYRGDILEFAWGEAVFETAAFFDRLRLDYVDHENLNSLFVRPTKATGGIFLIWSMLSVNRISSLAHVGKITESEFYYKELKDTIYFNFYTEEKISVLANAAFNMLVYFGERNSLGKAEFFYSDIEDIFESFSDPSIVLSYAFGSFNMINYHIKVSNYDSALVFYTNLKKLIETNSKDSDLYLLQARAAFNLACGYCGDQFDRAIDLYDDLKVVASTEFSTSAICVEQAKCAFNLLNTYCRREQLENAEEVYDDLKLLTVSNLGNFDVAFEQVKGAFRLAYEYALAKNYTKSITFYFDIKDLVNSKIGSAEIALEQARGALNLITLLGIDDRLEEAKAFYDDIRKLSINWRRPEIAFRKAKGAYYLWTFCLKANQPKEAEEYYSEFSSISKKYPDIHELIKLSEKRDAVLASLSPTS